MTRKNSQCQVSAGAKLPSAGTAAVAVGCGHRGHSLNVASLNPRIGVVLEHHPGPSELRNRPLVVGHDLHYKIRSHAGGVDHRTDETDNSAVNSATAHHHEADLIPSSASS